MKSVVVADTDRHGIGDAHIGQEDGIRYIDHDLMSGKHIGAKPAYHDGGERERGCLHAHLDGYRPAQSVEELDIVDVDPGSLPILHIDLVFRAEEEDTEIEDEDDEARGEGCPCCSHQSEFWCSEIAVDEHPVEKDVPGIGNEDDGHIDDGVVDAVGHLTECRREEEEWHRAYLDDEIRAHEWQELIGLSHVGEHEIEPYEQGHDDHALKGIGNDAALENLDDALFLVLGVERTKLRHGSDREAEREEDGQDKEIIDQSCCCQFLGRVTADHDVVGKVLEGQAQLSDCDWQS